MIYTELPNLALQQQIDLLEGRHLEGQPMRPFQFQALNNFRTLQLKRLNVPDKHDPHRPRFFPDTTLLLALYKLGLGLRYLVYHHRNVISLHLLVTEQEQGILTSWVRKQVDTEAVEAWAKPPPILSQGICFTGIPREKPAPPGSSVLETLATGLRDIDWQLLIFGHPRSEEEVAALAGLFREQIEAVEIRYLHGEIQEKDRAAQHYVKLLEYYLERFQKGLHSGVWQSGLYFLAEEPGAVDIAAGIICSGLYNENPLAMPLRSHRFDTAGRHNSVCNFLTIDELVHCFRLPDVELPGLGLREVTAFDIDPPMRDPSTTIEIGTVLDHHRRPCAPAVITPENLKKHTLVAGVTGSGKTNTIFQILVQGWQRHGIPFLVVEPAKGEYRALFHRIPELQVYTLGYEHPDDSLPFRLNPFYVPEGVPLQSHIDHLKSVFFSSFALYPPMPYVLEECLHRIYLDRGWNLVTGRNDRGDSSEAYPTLDDLHAQIAPVVARLGYEERLSKDIRAALETRINSLRLGAKGLMLNTRQLTDFERLFHQPTVLELKYVGNEDEKSFLMALIFVFLYEYRESRAQRSGKEPVHLLVIEEAHRLLRNTDKQRRSDESNARAEAIESFTNILAEIRAYGQGVIIADQIPSHLAPEVLKNTNLKVAHRIVAYDEREILGQSMVCHERQRLHLAQLKTGEAVLYQEGMDMPNLIRVHWLDWGRKELPDTRKLRTGRKDVAPRAKLEFELLRGDRAAQVLYDLTRTDRPFHLVGKILLAILAGESPEQVMAAYLEGWHVLQERFSEREAYVPAVFGELVSAELERRGQFYSMDFETTETVCDLLQEMGEYIRTAAAVDKTRIRKLAERVRELWTSKRTGKAGPFSGCMYCESACLLRYEGQRLAENRSLDRDILDALQAGEESRWEELARIADHTVARIYAGEETPLRRDVVICYWNHVLNRLGFSRKNVNFIVKEIHRRFMQ